MDIKSLTLIDTHCHPQFPQYDLDRDEVIRRALDAGIGMICVGTDLGTSQQAIALAEKYEGLWASVGLHPNDDGEVVSEFETLIKHSKVVAVGEVGLDYYRSADRREQQIERLKKFIELALRYDKPLIIHCRDAVTGDQSNGAHQDMQQLLPKHRGVIHSFTGTKEQALGYVERGYHIGFNGIITFARNYDDALRAVPDSALLLETDSPYLTPNPHRGKRNEPSYISEVARTVTEIRGANIVGITTKNAKRLFDIDK